MARFQVSLDGFTFTKHVGPDGEEHLAPVHRGDYATVAKIADTYVVEAHDELHAQAVFQKLMGIKSTTRDYKVHLVRPKGKKAEPDVPKAKNEADELEDGDESKPDEPKAAGKKARAGAAS